MKNHLQLFAIAVLAASSALGGALASPSDPGIDLESIRQRAADQTSEAEALASTARERAKTLTTDASSSAEGAKANGWTYAGLTPRSATADTTFDFDRMVADAGDMAKDGLGEAPRFIAFASLSMPPQSLRQMLDDVAKAGGVVVFRDVMLLEPETGPLRVSLGKDSRVEALAPFDGWSSLPAWDVAGALARVRAHAVDPLELPNELHEEVVLDAWQLGEPTTQEQRHTFPVRARGLVLDGVVADGSEGQALRDNLERLRKRQAPMGLGPGTGKGKASGSGRLFGVLHYETCRFVLQPLALLTAAGPIHLMTSAEGIDHKALLRNLVRR